MDTKNRGGRPAGTNKINLALRRSAELAAALEALDRLHGEHLAAFAKSVLARAKADREALSILKGM
jgi:hypothetical protein